MKKALLCISLLFHFWAATAQNLNRCGYELYKSNCALADPDYLNRRAEIDQQISNFAVNSKSRSEETFRIPVVFHVIYNNDTQNLSDEKIQEQLDILNRDYGRLNADSVNTREEFLPVAASTGIEFYLAQWDPNGNSTTGITHTQTDQATFFNLQFDLNRMKSSSTGGVDAWDVNHYMNIWVCNLAVPILNTPLVLGFATPPDGAPNWPAGSAAEEPQYDGVVLHYEVVGENPNASGALATVNKGRTATHEVGHYLGLRHIWGDGQGQDGCSVDDGLEDTPNCSDAQQQTCDYTANTCTDSPVDFPDQIENYMDYSDENCMNMFTQQQANAMRYVVENFRQDLLLSNDDVTFNMSSIVAFPNPAKDILNLVISKEMKSFSMHALITSVDGRIVKVLSPQNQTIDVSDLEAGIYFLNFPQSGSAFSVRFVKM
jgi:hypothetical protein